MTNELEILLQINTPTLRRFALILTGNQDDAEDLFQETAERIIRHAGRFASDTNFKAWATTIMRNSFINNYRKAKNHQRHEPHFEHFNLTVSQNNAQNDGEQKMNIERIEAAIEKLDIKMRHTFKMYFNGYHYQEIADEMHEPLGTIKSRIHQARVHLKKELVEYRMAS